MKDRVPTYPGRVIMTPVDLDTNTYDLSRADEATVEGTALNKATLLTDATASQLGLSSSDPTVNEALAAAVPLNRGVWHSRSHSLTLELGTATTVSGSSTSASSTIWTVSYVSSASMDEAGNINLTREGSISLKYNNVSDYASTLTGKYFWLASSATKRPYDALYYGTGTITGSTDGSTYTVTIPCRPVNRPTSVGSWSGEFSDSASAHTKGITGSTEYEFTKALMSAGPNMKCKFGFYEGSATDGAHTIATLSCDFHPLLLILQYKYAGTSDAWSRTHILLRGQTMIPLMYTEDSSYDYNVGLTWNAESIVLRSTKSSGVNAFDRENTNYPYLIIGI